MALAKVTHVVARKDYPAFGISKDEKHYTWVLFTGAGSRTCRQKTPPRRSQLTTSEYLSSLYGIEENLESMTQLSELDDIIEDLRNLCSETQDRLDNMPEGLQSSPTGELLQNRINGIETAISELEDMQQEYENLGIDYDADGAIIKSDADNDDDVDVESEVDDLLRRVREFTIDAEG